jgi:hypothetical protein
MGFDSEYPQPHNIHHAIQKTTKQKFKLTLISSLTLAPEINLVFKSIGFPTYNYN